VVSGSTCIIMMLSLHKYGHIKYISLIMIARESTFILCLASPYHHWKAHHMCFAIIIEEDWEMLLD